ncbi:MAG: cytochrome C [Candidatus Hydrogenedentes bacterium]|nr:cytochrome C [Candidatus Hydrogenedentota bacterium]
MTRTPRGWKWAIGQLVWRNWLTLFGSSLTTVSALAIIVFMVLGGAGVALSPYIGLLTYLVLPGIFVFGLLLIPLGAWVDRRRRRRLNEDEPAHIDLDFNNPRIRRLAMIVTVLTAANIAIISAVSYEGAVYMESVAFCGTTCHTVMEPEFTAHMNSPHAHISCVECHIGPGLSAMVHAKLNGLNQVYGVLTGSYERPVPTPVHGMANAELTCGECHNPGMDLGNTLRVTTDYATDDANTPLTSVLLMRVGGRGVEGTGIHNWHLAPGREVYFYSPDDKREVITYVKVANEDGTEVEYFVDGAEVDPASLPPGALRKMDCTDCHNRASHVFEMPGPALNKAIARGEIDVALPSVKAAGLEALEGAVAAEDGPAFIAKSVQDYYAANYADAAAQQQALIDRAIASMQGIYKRNIFPKMNIGWGTYPDHNGHTMFNGCFRCHDDGHSSRDGAHVISQDCTACHNVVTWQEENPEILSTLGLQ